MNEKMLGNMNEWTFSGEIFYLKEQFGEFGASMRLRGVSQRAKSNTTQICEITCLVPSEVYKDFKARKIKTYDKAAVAGHIETWQKVKDSGRVEAKQMLIVDYLLEAA